MRYSMLIDSKGVAMAQGYDINASFKDLSVVCDAIRYLKVESAMDVLDGVIAVKTPIIFLKFNRYMGSRHELGGKKGAFPSRAASEIKKILINAVANSKGKGLDADSLYIVHASANKTRIERRKPSKGSLSWGRGAYGMSASVHSDLEYAKIEIGLAPADEKALTSNMKYFIKARNNIKEAAKQKPKPVKAAAATVAKQEVKKEAKPEEKQQK